MQTVNRTEDTQISTIELVLKEILEEQQKANQFGTDLVAAFNQLSSRVESFNEKLENQAVTSPPVSTKPIEDMLQTELTKIETIVAAQPKNVVKKFQISLYPEQHADLFYKIIFKSWVPLIAAMFLIDGVHDFAIHQSDNNKEIKLKEMKNFDFKKASYYHYWQENSEGQRLMGSIIDIGIYH